MSGILLRLKTWWQVADRTQKLIMACGGGFLVVLLIGTFIFASRPKMSLVFNNLDPEDTGNVAMEIENMGIPVTFDNNGNVFVPSEKRAQVRASLAMKGKLPKAGSHVGDDLSKISPWTNQVLQNEQLKAISENELAQAIQFFDGVDSASVQITPAVDSVFEADKKPAQANVTVSEKPGGLVTEDEARAMANLVASAVRGLDKTKVSIFTRTGRALWDGEDMAGPGPKSTTRLDMQKQEARKKRDELQDALNRMLGPGNAIAMVDLTLNLDSPTDTTEKTTPTKPLVDQKVTEEVNSTNGTSAAPPAGAAGNDPTTGAAPGIGAGATIVGGGGSKYTSVQSKKDYGYETTRRVNTHVPGEVQTMAITVLVNQTDKIKIDPKSVDDPVVKLANSALPPHVNGDTNFTASVVTYPFDTTQADIAKKAEASAATSNTVQQILSVLPIAALLIVAFLVVRSLGKLANRPLPPMLIAAANGPALPMSGGGAHTGGNLASLFGHQQQQQPVARALDGANQFVLPEIVKQKALEAGITEEQLQAAIEEAGDAGISIDDIPSIKSKINVPLEQIKKMASERPEVVAMLIKSWLIEEGVRR